MIGVGLQNDIEASLFERLGYRLGIVDGIAQGSEGVVGIADDKGGAGRGRLGLGDGQRGGQGDDIEA